jgi:uncharacterized protein YrrD
MLRVMEDLGAPASYLTLEKGMPVYSSDGKKVGRVEHVLADFELDVFDGIVLDTSILPGGHRFVDASQMDEVYERGVVLAVDSSEAERLPEPSESAAALSASPDDTTEGELERRLRRAWDLISGKR